MPSLIVEKGVDKGKSVSVASGETVLIGRDSSTALPVRDTMASRMHFKIEASDGTFWIHDLESMNGTFVNGNRVKERVALEFGDLIGAGETLFTFQSDRAPSDPLLGQRMGGYRVIERVGRGGMGTVYKAEQIDLQRIVALKVIGEEHTKNKDFIDLFIHEARAAAKLNHPNIVQVYDVKRHNDLYYFSMEYVAGGSVQEALNRQRKLSIDRAVAAVLDAARGLEYAHRKGILHRDIKPDNLMISETGTVKIGDMGLARAPGEKVGPEEETSVMGTPHYIAPELVMGQSGDFRSDQYSLGASLYRMLSGSTPFHAPSVRELVQLKVREDAPPLHPHYADVPKGLAGVVSRMIARNPEERFPSMTEVVEALDRIQRGETREEPASGPARRRRAVLSVLLVTALAGILIWIFASGRNPVVTDPGPAPPDLALAAQTLENVKLRENRKMDESHPGSIRKVIDDYQSVMDRFSGTPYAKEAAELKGALEIQLRNLLAQKRLELLEADDVAAYRRVEVDPASVEAVAAAYQAFASTGEGSGTPAGEEAARRAAHIRSWASAVGTQAGAFEAMRIRLAPLVEASRFGEAAAAWEEYAGETRRSAMECPFSEDRYRGLLFDRSAEKAREEILSRARTAWEQARGEAMTLAAEGRYEEALARVESVLRDSVEEVMPPARSLKNDLETDWALAARAKAESRERERAEALRKAGEVFARESALAHRDSLRFDFESALGRMKRLRGTGEPGARLDRRVAELERAARFKETLIGVINARDGAAGNPYRFRRKYSTSAIEGTIRSADDASIQVELEFGGGLVTLPWAQFDAPSFHRFVTTQWKYSPEQRRDPGEQCNFAAACMELGLYEEALAEISFVLEALKDPQYEKSVSEAVRSFLPEYRDRLEGGITAEHDEVEAEKRLRRLDSFMEARNYAAARKEIDLLRGGLRGTKAVREAQDRIGEHLRRIAAEGGELLDKSLRESRLRKLDERVGRAQEELRKSEVEVQARLARLRDPFERALYQGMALGAVGDWRKSTERLMEAKRVGENLIARREVDRNFLPALGLAYAMLYRNAVVQKDPQRAEAIRGEGARRFAGGEGDSVISGWKAAIKRLSEWGERTHPAGVEALDGQVQALRKSPEDPAKIWDVAHAWSEILRKPAEAVGYYSYLQENHPEFAQVRNGACLHRLAEIHFEARNAREAIRLYRQVEKNHPDNPKVTEHGVDGVSSRLDACYRLLVKMGYSKEE